MENQINTLKIAIANAWRNNEFLLWNNLRTELEVLIIKSYVL